MGSALPHDLLEGITRSYVDGGNLHAAMFAVDTTCFPTIKFVSFENGRLRLLVCGDYPGGDAPWLWNICNKKFCDSARDVTERAIPVV